MSIGSPINVASGDLERMTVVDISFGGCGFTTAHAHSLNPDDRIKLVFNLDDAKHTRIERDAAVRAVKGTHQIGCEFAPTASGYDPDIGFYLRPT